MARVGVCLCARSWGTERSAAALPARVLDRLVCVCVCVCACTCARSCELLLCQAWGAVCLRLCSRLCLTVRNYVWVCLPAGVCAWGR